MASFPGLDLLATAVVALDDGYNPDPCIRNTIQLLDREKVFLLSNYVGTPTLTRALPVIKQLRDTQTRIAAIADSTGRLANLPGASFFRTKPPRPPVERPVGEGHP